MFSWFPIGVCGFAWVSQKYCPSHFCCAIFGTKYYTRQYEMWDNENLISQSYSMEQAHYKNVEIFSCIWI